MSVFVIGYDLNRPRGLDAYPNLIAAIKQIGTWWHHLDSTWIVSCNYSAIQIRDYLKPHIDSGDELLVAKLSGEWASSGFNSAGTSWLRDNVAA